MFSPHSDGQRRRRRLIITLTATGLVIAVLAGVGIYGLITGPRGNADAPGDRPPASMTSVDPADPNGQPEEAELPVLARTNNPEAYVRAVAAALFNWDTFTLLTPSDHRAVLIEEADPSGTETPGLISDLDGYFPSTSTWRDLAEYRTRQHLEIDRVFVPAQWEEAIAVSGGQIADGTVAYTVEGIRHRDGVWYDDPVTSEHAVAFTVFVSCEPVFDRCHLLRLSELDNPLR
ncbi:hypothetical protein [Mycetocola reblochoni]|uniref:Uncharacterized protein n=1 Tax=Mycetocola reblochoni TaxID=331618 RepID=A0A3L6ZLM9_9MICO|nr:hypothetical protein [Mycetocola reblochoni]RLP68777.1 hypothetical protein D9V30_09475 [Mycetocola reblochoni]